MMQLRLGIKSDPIEYRYSFPWLFRLMVEEGVTALQLGSFFEMYQLPDAWFVRLRHQAADHGVAIESVFTAHRELGGFFHEDPAWTAVARRNYERLIEVAALVGARNVGSNPGAVHRDLMGLKATGVQRYLAHMKELMRFARERGIEWLTIEPMSCLAEPPTLPAEIRAMGEELAAWHTTDPAGLARVGYCADISHGYLSADESICVNHIDLFTAALPWLVEVHLKNTDRRFNSTFGFQPANLETGIVDAAAFRKLIEQNVGSIPVDTLTCYLEIGGPKLGRDYSDIQLEAQLRESIQYLKQKFVAEATPCPVVAARIPVTSSKPAPDAVAVAPSMMCVDPLNFETSLRQVEALGVDLLHMDIMDGRFVPNMPLGLGMIAALRRKTGLPIDVHLMVEDNDFFIRELASLHVYQISIHAESSRHLDRSLESIRASGARAGLAINPATPLETLDYALERIDYVLLMTVNPGFAGQKLTPASIRKIRDCRRYLDARGYNHLPIQVDGNVSFANIPDMVAAGAQCLVAGTSSIFSAEDSWDANLRRLKAAIVKGESMKQAAIGAEAQL
jgi:ribulose-phosphate 3-epimerase